MEEHGAAPSPSSAKPRSPIHPNISQKKPQKRLPTETVDKKKVQEISKNSRMNSQTETVGRNWVIKDEHHPELRDCCR